MNRRLVFVAAPLMAIAVGTSALGAWKANAPAGAASSRALTVPQVTGVNAADGTGSSVITWTAVTAAQFSPGVTGYKVVRYSNSTGSTGATTVCANASGATCTDSSGTAGTFWYGVSALYAPTGTSWTGAESTRDQAVVTAAATSPAGIVLTGITTNPSPVLTAGGTVAARTYSSTGEGSSSGNTLTASIQLVDSSGNAFTNTSGSAITIDLAKTASGTGSDGSVTPSAGLTIANNASTTSGTFTATRSNGQGKTLTVTATIHGTSKTITITMSS